MHVNQPSITCVKLSLNGISRADVCEAEKPNTLIITVHRQSTAEKLREVVQREFPSSFNIIIKVDTSHRFI